MRRCTRRSCACCATWRAARAAPALPVSVCGEMAADPVLLPLLTGLGLREFSMTPAAIPAAKQVVRGLRIADTARLASRALKAATAGEVERVLAESLSAVKSREIDLVCHDEGAIVSEITKVEKPWGYELHWAKTDRYVGKLIHVNAGHALSLQYHNQKDETIFLWAGQMLFEIAEGHEGTAGGPLTKREMKPGEAVHVTPKTVHRMTAITDCDIFEVSTPELQDVVRLEDRYGRQT